MLLLKVLFSSVFNPKKMSITSIQEQIVRYGFVFMFLRWSYYSNVFTFFRNYENSWAPFVKPPFNMPVDTYAFWQGKFAVLFGFLLTAIMAAALFFLVKKNNERGPSYFISFVILQPLDRLIMNLFDWNLSIIRSLHTALRGVLALNKRRPRYEYGN